MTTPNLQLPEVPQAIQEASDEINGGFQRLDAIVQLSVLSRAEVSPPGTAVQGNRFIVPDTGGVGTWSTRGRQVAYRSADGWAYFPPRTGWRAYVEDEDAWYVYKGVAWVLDAGGGGGGGSTLTVIDLDDTPDETILNVDTIAFSDAEVTDAGGGQVVVKVSPLTAKGDLYTRTAAGVERLPVGSNGKALIANSLAATGLDWATLPTTQLVPVANGDADAPEVVFFEGDFVFVSVAL